jgi:glutamate racemase
VACNTVSAIALSEIRAKFAGIPVIGVLDAGVRACLKANPKYVAVIGTRATVSSDAYRREIHAVNPEINIKTIACPLLVPIVEEGFADNEICRLTVDFYLKSLKKETPDMLLLACTHYPLLKKTFRSYLPKKLKIVDSADACAKFAEEYLRKNSLSASKRTSGTERFYVTDMPDSFFKQAKKFLGRDLEHFQKISISEN